MIYCTARGLSRWYLALKFFSIASGKVLSLSNGPPGANLIKKKLAVAIMSKTIAIQASLRSI